MKLLFYQSHPLRAGIATHAQGMQRAVIACSGALRPVIQYIDFVCVDSALDKRQSLSVVYAMYAGYILEG